MYISRLSSVACAGYCVLYDPGSPYFLDLKTLPPGAATGESFTDFATGGFFSLTPATRFSFRLPLLPTPFTPPLFSPEVTVPAVAFVLACEVFDPRVSAEFSWLLPELVAAVSVDERFVARDEGRLELETSESLEGTMFRGVLVVVLVVVLIGGFTVIVVGGDEQNKSIGELGVGGRLGFEGDRARARDVFATVGIGGGGICSRAEVAAVFLAVLFLGTTRRAD